VTQTASERIHALVTPDALQLPASGQAPITLVVTNRGRVVDQLQLQVAGLDPAWYTLEVPSINLLPETSGGLRLDVHVPPDAVAGDYTLHLTIASQEDPAESVQVDVPLQILAQGAMGLELIPAVVTSRRLGRFRVHASNTSNELRSIDLVATDPDEALELALDRDHLTLDPGADDSVWLTARPRQRPLIAPPRTLPFTVTAMAGTELSEPLAGVQGRLVYRAPLAFLVAVPPRVRALALAALGLLLAAAILIWLLGQPGVHGPFAEPSPTVAPTTAPAAAAQPAQPTVAAGAPPAAPAAAPAPTSAAAATPVPLPTIQRFELVMPSDPQQGQPSLVWAVDGADSVTINGDSKPASGSQPIQPLANSQYELAATNAGGTVRKAVGIVVLQPPAIDDFTASATQIDPGQTVSLHWKAHGAQHATLLGQSVDPTEGTGEIQLNQTTTLTLEVSNELGGDTRSIQVTVRGSPAGQ